MKKIIIKKSSITERESGVDYSNYYITYPTQPSYGYTTRASVEGIGYAINIFKEAGYEIEFIQL